MKLVFTYACACALAATAPAWAQDPDPDPEDAGRPAVDIHGFVSEGAFVSTANDYIGKSSRGSLELFEVALNASSEVADRLRVGVQLFARDVGDFDDASPRIDWAFLDYRWRPWLGIRAGVIKMPFGLYAEYADIDSARTAILMPQGVYPVRNREATLAHRGFTLYGSRTLGGAGELEYQAWLGTLSVPDNALTLSGSTLETVDTKYVAGAQAYWHPPVDGLRFGATFARASIDFYLRFSEATVAAAIVAGIVPPDFDGSIVVSQRPITLAIGSVEYSHDDWLFAAEYSRVRTRQNTTLPSVFPTTTTDSEAFYGLVTRRLSRWLELGGYYSVTHPNVDDRRGKKLEAPQRYFAFQRDLAASVRFDVNAHWLWKLEGHFIHGTSDLVAADNPDPEPYWGLVLLKTTVTF
ncbi:MAG: hypothetical protein ABI867_33555 [Kofleriaceae bacterium]